mmetsp:Transcript_28598/g.68014  ORF Transcript_28598/g.68014 Transcript_28598/m.68014 type:complete len:280 (+) Transcript_28598:1204-2043(+)
MHLVEGLQVLQSRLDVAEARVGMAKLPEGGRGHVPSLQGGHHLLRALDARRAHAHQAIDCLGPPGHGVELHPVLHQLLGLVEGPQLRHPRRIALRAQLAGVLLAPQKAPAHHGHRGEAGTQTQLCLVTLVSLVEICDNSRHPVARPQDFHLVAHLERAKGLPLVVGDPSFPVLALGSPFGRHDLVLLKARLRPQRQAILPHLKAGAAPLAERPSGSPQRLGSAPSVGRFLLCADGPACHSRKEKTTSSRHQWNIAATEGCIGTARRSDRAGPLRNRRRR